MPIDYSPAVAVRNISKAFGSFAALDKISFEVAQGRFVSIVGPSGCGKSTLLNIIAGLTSPSEGEIEAFGEPLVGINRRASYIDLEFQNLYQRIWRNLRKEVLK